MMDKIEEELDSTYNTLHAGDVTAVVDPKIDDEIYDHHHKHKDSVTGHSKTAAAESMDFEEVESVMWRKHQLRRFFQDRGHWWSAKKRSTVWKWTLVVIIGVAVGLVGSFVQVFSNTMTEWKLETATSFIESGDWASSFFAYVFCSVFLAGCAGFLCWHEPAAAGSGIPEIKAFLNGVNLDKVVRVRVVIAKVFGMCFSCAAGLPLGKEGPMIHAGSIIGAAVSLGQTITYGFDTSWNKFQDFRNDRSKLDFVTIGAAAGIGAAFRAPIGGVLFTLEEGASFWSTTLTIRAFVCATITMLTVSICGAGVELGRGESAGIFTFGQFDNLEENKTNYYLYELFIFAIIGSTGGMLGALFNRINEWVTIFRIKNLNAHKWKRIIELLLITATMAVISFILPVMWRKCTKIPTDTSFMSTQEINLLGDLVQFQCEEGEYNELASLYFTSADICMRQLYHYREFDHTSYDTFTAGPLILFFIPYFLLAAITAGVLAPAGLFVPTLVAGAAYGRLWGYILNQIAPGHVADSGTYALIGASAILGGMARMTIAGTVIVLEAAGNMAYLLPLMVTFAAARYTGNAINLGMYEIQINLKNLPFLEGSLHSLGLLNYCAVTEIMTKEVVVLEEVEKVGRVLKLLKETTHNGFPVVNKAGQLRGLILRKTICSLLKLKAYSTPVALPVAVDVSDSSNGSEGQGQGQGQAGGIQLVPSATVFYDTLERSYPLYPEVDDLKLNKNELGLWLDMRPYMDTAPYSIDQSASVHRCYKLFRTMGLRHLVVVNTTHTVTGIVTRQDVTEHNLHHLWAHEGQQLQKFINVEPIPAAVVYESRHKKHVSHRNGGGGAGDDDEDDNDGAGGAAAAASGSHNGVRNRSVSENTDDRSESDGGGGRDRGFSVDPSAGLEDSPQFGSYRKSLNPPPASKTDMATVKATVTAGVHSDALKHAFRQPILLSPPSKGILKK